MRSLRTEGDERKSFLDAVRNKLGIATIIIDHSGWPDDLILIPHGRPMFVEFKKCGEPLKRTQPLKRKLLLRLGYDYAMHDNAVEAFEDVKRHYEAAAERFKRGA